MSEEIIKYFTRDWMEVPEEDAELMVITTIDNGQVIGQETLLAERLAAELEGMSESLMNPMDGNLKQDLPASQAFSDVGESEDNTKLGKYFDEKSDTGDDHSRTGPGGNAPADNYDKTHYEGQSTTKLNAATGIELEDEPKKIYDISGTPPELQEDIKITIEIDDDSLELIDESQDTLKKGDLKNHEGRKDPGTHTNTIKAGELEIDKLLPVSPLWKEKNDGIGPYAETKQFSFFGDERFGEAIYHSGENPQEQFNQASSWIGTVTWNPETLDAIVVMNGKKYNHAGVGGKDYAAFEGAPSKGAHWNRHWKGQFQSSNYSEALMLQQKEHYEFDWIDDAAIEEMKKYANSHGSGKFILAVVSGDTKTDHRAEGVDKHQRHWTREELIQNIRTGKGKMTDINHMWQKIDPESGGVFDANWNFKTDRGEMILWETDQDILDAIKNDVITAVSINTGSPRKIHTNCDSGECFLQPHGTVLGESNGVALAFVVTDPAGFNYNGQIIPAFPPGMKFTKMYVVE
jgi:hypothetical protein